MPPYVNRVAPYHPPVKYSTPPKPPTPAQAGFTLPRFALPSFTLPAFSFRLPTFTPPWGRAGTGNAIKTGVAAPPGGWMNPK